MKSTKITLGGLSRQERHLLATVRREGISIINNEVLTERAGLSRAAANQALLRLEKKGWLQRVKRGQYVLVDLTSTVPTPIIEDALALAMDLFSPCYLTGWTAAEHWGLTEQIFNSVLVHSATYQRASEKKAGGIKFVIRRIKSDEIFGTKTIWSSNRKVEMADKPRTIIDILNRPEDGGGAELAYEICKAYLSSPEANSTALLEYAERLDNRAIFKRLGFVAEQATPSKTSLIAACHQKISKGLSLFDPTGPQKGRIYSRWNLRVNITFGAS